MHRPILFNELALFDKLFEHCAEIDETARNRMELIVRSLAEQNGVTEQLKAKNQMEWVRQMNTCKAQADVYKRQEMPSGQDSSSNSQSGDSGSQPPEKPDGEAPSGSAPATWAAVALPRARRV